MRGHFGEDRLVRLSRRTAYDATLNPLERAVRARREAGAPLLDLTVSNPTRVGLLYPDALVRSAFSVSDPLRYDPAPFGLDSARAAVAAVHAVDPNDVILTASTSEAYGMLFKVLCDPGDVVLAPEPSYPLFAHLAAFEGVELRPYRLAYDGAWHIDLGHLRGQIDERCRAILVVHPNNPTGHYTSRTERDALAALGLPLISDEVFASYPLGRPPECATLLGAGVPTFVLSGLSKLAGLPQMKAGWIITNPAARAAHERLELVADTALSIGAPVQHALPTLLGCRDLVADAIRARTRLNLARLQATLAGRAATVLRAEGGWSAVVELPRVRSELEWALALLDQDVVIQPGWLYDFEREAFVVLSLLTPEDRFEDGVRRLSALVDAVASEGADG